MQIRAILGWGSGDLLDHTPHGGDLDLAHAVHPAQQVLVEPLDPHLADRLVEVVSLGLETAPIGSINSPQITQQMSCRWPHGVIAPGIGDNFDPRQLV